MSKAIHGEIPLYQENLSLFCLKERHLGFACINLSLNTEQFVLDP